MMERTIRIILAMVLATFPLLCPAEGKAADEETAYDQIFKGKKTESAEGVMTLRKTEDKIYLEVPVRLFGRHFISGSIVEKSNNPMESPAGFCPARPRHFFFEKSDSTLLMRSFREGKTGSPEPGINQALSASHIAPILESFKIEAWTPDSSAAVIDMSSFFLNDGKYYNPIDPKAYNSMDGYVKRNGTFSSNDSFISGIKAYEDHISVMTTVSYKIRAAFLGVFKAEKDTYLTADIRHSIILLPEKKMHSRIADRRIGTGKVSHMDYDDRQSGMRRHDYATRWNLEKGPVQFYIDDSFPESWIPYIKKSLDAWKETFKANGLPDAIRWCMYSEAGPDFDPSDIMNTCIRYVPSPTGKILDSRWEDPTTGEILRAGIYINHGIRSKIQKDLFLQTGAAFPEARTMHLSDATFGEALSSLLLKNIGHCLGLEDNLAGSAAFPADSLRSASFTGKHGLSASVMDMLPFNFIADSTDVRNGAVIMQQKPGIYDRYAIGWLYGKLPEGLSQQQEETYLKHILEEKEGVAAYRYGKPQDKHAFFDPRTMELDLGNNSKEAAERGFRGLEELVSHAGWWLEDEDIDYTYREELYDEIVNLCYEYVKQVFVNVGGIYMDRRQSSGENPTYCPVSKETQKEFLNWIMRQVSDFSWMDNEKLAQDVGLLGSIGDFCQKYYSRFIFSQIGEMWVSESKSENPYTQLEAMQDVSDYVWRDCKSGKSPADITRYQQDLFIEYLVMWSEQDKNSAGSSKIRYKSGPVRTHEWYGMLQETEKTVNMAEKRAKDENVRNHYRYLHWKIRKALK